MQRELPDGYLAGQRHVVAERSLVAIYLQRAFAHTGIKVVLDIFQRAVLLSSDVSDKGLIPDSARFLSIPFPGCGGITYFHGLAVGADSDVAGDGGRAVGIDGLNLHLVLRAVMDEGYLVACLPDHVDGSSGTARCDLGVLGTCAGIAAGCGDGGGEVHLAALLRAVVQCSVFAAAGGHHQGCCSYTE